MEVWGGGAALVRDVGPAGGWLELEGAYHSDSLSVMVVCGKAIYFRESRLVRISGGRRSRVCCRKRVTVVMWYGGCRFEKLRSGRPSSSSSSNAVAG